MVDYSRFDGIVDSEDEDAPREEQPVRPQRGPSQLPSPSSGGGAPTDIMDDLNDYFSRLEARRQEQIDAGQPPPSVDRFTQSELETLPTFTFNASETQYEECSVCLNDFAPGEVLLKLPCAAQHLLHKGCAAACLTRSVLCPLCRVDLKQIMPTAPTQHDAYASYDASHPREEAAERPLTPRQLGFTRDGGVIQRYEPNPPADMPRPSYIPAALHHRASYVEIAYPAGAARIWRVPREYMERHGRADDGAD